MQAELSSNSTADQIWQALPVSAPANVWGDEIYFSLPVQATRSDDAVEEVDVGDLAYWPPGNAFCIFFGPTPVSRGVRPRAASPVNLFGRLLGDATIFRAVSDGTEVTVSALAE
jgi:hypothetical protein